MGQGIFLGEALLPLQEIEEQNLDRALHDLPQIQLPLTRPQDHGMHKNSINLNGWGFDCSRTFFKWLFLHEKKGLEVPNFVTFPNSL